MAFSRDSTVLLDCRFPPHAPVQARWSVPRGEGSMPEIIGIASSADGTWIEGSATMTRSTAYPPCGILPHRQLALYAVPLCYLYGSEFQIFHVFRNMVRTHLSLPPRPSVRMRCFMASADCCCCSTASSGVGWIACPLLRAPYCPSVACLKMFSRGSHPALCNTWCLWGVRRWRSASHGSAPRSACTWKSGSCCYCGTAASASTHWSCCRCSVQLFCCSGSPRLWARPLVMPSGACAARGCSRVMCAHHRCCVFPSVRTQGPAPGPLQD